MLREHQVTVEDDLAELLRAGVGTLAKEICVAIGDAVPAYRDADERRYRTPIRPIAELILETFVERLAYPDLPVGHLEAHCRRLGRLEALNGRSLTAVHMAFQVAGRVGWRHVTRVSKEHRLPTGIVARLAEVQLAYIDELTRMVADGYAEAKEQTPEQRAELRLNLLRRIIATPAPSSTDLADLAASAGWNVPAEVTLIAVRPGPRWVPHALHSDVLADTAGPRPYVLIPGPANRDRITMLRRALPDSSLAIGVTAAPDTAADSLRWARRALRLAAERTRVTRCDDQLLDLWLHADPALTSELRDRLLSGFERVSEPKRKILEETLRVWLDHWSTAAEVGALLHVHPQTVRYRLRQLREYLGDGMDDPQQRFGLQLALRAAEPR